LTAADQNPSINKPGEMKKRRREVKREYQEPPPPKRIRGGKAGVGVQIRVGSDVELQGKGTKQKGGISPGMGGLCHRKGGD